MEVLPATEITASLLVSSTAPVAMSGQLEWVQQLWPAGSVVFRNETRRLYRAVVSVPSGFALPPEQDIAQNQLPYWQDIGPMNQWAMFDGELRTQTVTTGDLVVKIKPGVISSVWVGNIQGAETVRVILRKTDGTVVYDQSQPMREKVTTYWDWWFAPFRTLENAAFVNIPAYLSSEVEIRFEGAGEVRVGMTAVGKSEVLGKTEWGVDADFQNYSSRSLDSPWGPTQGTGGEVTKDVTYRVFVNPDDAPYVDRFVKTIMKRPAVFIPIGDAQFEGIRIFGQAISGRMGYPQPNYVPLDITVREFL